MHEAERDSETWDLSFFATKGEHPLTESIRKGGQGGPLGALEEVRRKVSDHLSEVDWSDPMRGTYQGKSFRIEFLLGPEKPCRRLVARVHGRGMAIKVLLKLASDAHWFVWLDSHGQWIHDLPEEDLLALISIDPGGAMPPSSSR